MTKQITVTYAPGGSRQKPMIRLANNFITGISKFVISEKVNVEYLPGAVIIRKIN